MITWAYLAGFIDGDGWITVSKNKNCKTKRYLVGLTQSSRERDKIELINKFLNDNEIKTGFIDRISTTNILQKNGSYCCPMVNIHIKEQRSVVVLLEFLYPFLLIKKDKAKEAIDYTKDRLLKRGDPKNKILQIKRKYWKESQIKELIYLVGLGFSNQVISEKLNRSINSIGHKLYRLNIKRRFFNGK